VTLAEMAKHAYVATQMISDVIRGTKTKNNICIGMKLKIRKHRILKF